VTGPRDRTANPMTGAGSPATDTAGYRVLARHERFRGRMFEVFTDDVELPDGAVVRRDYVVHVGAVGVVALDEQDRVVLVQQYRHPVTARLWELPAGLIDVAGEPLAQAAARELAEEADLRAADWRLLTDVYTSPGCTNEVIRLFLARDLTPVPDAARYVRHEEEAGLVVRWVDLDEAVSMGLRGEISNAACLVGVLAAAALRARGWPRVRALDEPLDRRALPAVTGAVPGAGGDVP